MQLNLNFLDLSNTNIEQTNLSAATPQLKTHENFLETLEMQQVLQAELREVQWWGTKNQFVVLTNMATLYWHWTLMENKLQ